MAELEYQQALARFLTNPRLRESVLHPDRASNADAHDLPPHVLRRLRSLDPGRTSMFSQLLIVNRLAKIMEALPCTAWAFGARLWEVARLYNLLSPPSNPKKYNEAITFCSFLEATPNVVQLGPPWLIDAVCYERALLEMRFQTQPAPPIGQQNTRVGNEPLVHDRPRLSPTVRVCFFEHDIEEILSAFSQGQPTARPAQRPVWLLLQVQPEGTVRQDEISPAVVSLLELCTGAATVGDIVGLLAAQMGTESDDETFRGECVGMFRQLLDRGVLTIDSADREPPLPRRAPPPSP